MVSAIWSDLLTVCSSLTVRMFEFPCCKDFLILGIIWRLLVLAVTFVVLVLELLRCSFSLFLLDRVLSLPILPDQFRKLLELNIARRDGTKFCACQLAHWAQFCEQDHHLHRRHMPVRVASAHSDLSIDVSVRNPLLTSHAHTGGRRVYFRF